MSSCPNINREVTVSRFPVVAAAVPRVRVGDIDFNVNEIVGLSKKLDEEGADVVVFPELCVTGYTCADLFMQQTLLDRAENALRTIACDLAAVKALVIVGAPLRRRGRLYNCAVALAGGNIIGAVPKIHIPDYNEFYEKRWFESGLGVEGEEMYVTGETIPFGTDLLFRSGGATVGIEICEDLWVPAPPSGRLARQGADVIVNLSASDELIGKHDYLRGLVAQQSGRCRCAYVYASAGWGESSTDLVFSGNAMIAIDGRIVAEGKRFCPSSQSVTARVDIDGLGSDRMCVRSFFDGAESLPPVRTLENPRESLTRKSFTVEEMVRGGKASLDGLKGVSPTPFVPADSERLDAHCEEITSIQAWGLMRRLAVTGCKKAVIGISGGLDSTLALLVTAKAFDNLGLPRENIVAITMPGMGTTDRTHDNAWNLMGELGVTRREIPIGKAVALHFSDIGQDPERHDAAYENSQARERTQILMDVANMVGGMVIGTGDLSELALGWCTYNGDQMSMYGVNASVPKTLVKYLVSWHARRGTDEARRLLEDIIDTPISPELIPASSDGTIEQKTEDLVGPYELHDFYIFHTLRYGRRPIDIFRLARVAFAGKYDDATVLKWMRVFYRRFFSQQFKRSAMPDGPKVGSVCLSPRGDWRMPSDASSALWLAEVDRMLEALNK